MQALHITEMQDAVNLVRARAGLPAVSWQPGAASGEPIKASHILELRNRLDDVRIALGLSPPSYSLPAPSVGGPIRADHILELRVQIIEMFNATATGSANSSVARLDPDNRTGGGGADPLSRNFNWSVPLVGLPGRSGLDLGLSLSYNSLVWTKSGSAISFNDDRGFPSPGFRLGFPVIQPRYFNSQVGKWAYLLITPSGGRVELRQVGASNVYESADSSYLQMTEGAALTLLTTDGTRLSFSLISGEYRCMQINDRNGNYLTVAYYGDGRIDKIIDTLGRTITFIYDTSQNLISITQPWKRQTEGNPTGVDEVHPWATFVYTNLTLQPSFSSLTVIGTQPGTVIPVITQVSLGDRSYYKLSYNGWGQVWKVTHFAADSVDGQGVPNDSHPLSSTRLNLPGSDLLAATPQTDCPRFTEERTWVENGVMNQSAEITTSYSPWTPNMASCDVTVPDLTVFRQLYATSGWQKGLTTQSEVWSGGQRKKWTTLLWEHDGPVNSQFMTNPRVNDATVNDSDNNHRRTSVTFTSFGLPQEVTEYAANTTTPLRTRRTEYDVPNLSEYTSRRIIGLPSFQYLYEGTSATGMLVSKVGYVYDDNTLPEGHLNSLPSAATQHDATNYGTGLRWRGNANRVRRYDVTGGAGSFVESQISYNVTGTVGFSKDVAGHKSSLNYADSFYQGVNRSNPVLQTFAYPTTMTDPDLFTSSTLYNYDMGVVTESETPQPNATTDLEGPKLKHLYDAAGRTIQVTNSFDAGRTKWIYPSSMNVVQTFTLLDIGREIYSARLLDGVGRVRATVRDLPGSDGGYSGQLFDYDAMGRLARQSNPTETTAADTWPATGDDAPAGWLYTETTYDWRGRPLVVTNPGSPATTKEFDYSGCGCAGGEVVTVTDEGTFDTTTGQIKRREQKIYSDVLGRTVKTEVRNWQGGSVYSTVVNTYNARDHITLVSQSKGPEASTIHQDTTMTYDGFGRLSTKHVPQQDTGAVTTYNYNPDDTVSSVVDGRGARCEYEEYNGRHQVKSVTHALAGSNPINISYVYDAAGNRTSMSHLVNNVPQDSATYVYDQLSQLRSETRHINSIENSSTQGNYTIGYSYMLSGDLESVTDPFNATINYGYDTAGRTSSVTGAYGGTNYDYATGVKYRAFGAVKSASFGNNTSETVAYNARLQPSGFRLTGSNFLREDYSYNKDGRLSRIHDLDDTVGTHPPDTLRIMSRSFYYDHVGRIISGVGDSTSPYVQGYGYDEFDHLRSRGGSYMWQSGQSDSANYTNNRRDGWIYDADGRLKISPANSSSNRRNWSYDAAGQLTITSETAGTTTTTLNQTYDGDGQVIYESVNGFNPSSNYLIHSTVFAGATLTKLDAAGNKSITYVPAGGMVFPQQTKNGNDQPIVKWIQRDPQGHTEMGGGGFFGLAAYDPLGTYVPLQQHPPAQTAPTGMYGPSYFGASSAFNNGNNYSTGCRLDGVATSCDSLSRAIANGGIQPGSIVISTTGGGASIANAGWGSLTLSTATRTRRWVNDPLPKGGGPPTLLRKGEARKGSSYYDPYSPDNEGRPGHWEISTQINYVTGNLVGESPQKPLQQLDSDFAAVNPCAGAKASNLDYSKPRKYGKKTQTPEQHIRDRHINMAKVGNAGQYRDSLNPNANQDQIFDLVKRFNALTFTDPDSVQVLNNPYGPGVATYVFAKFIRPDSVENRVVGLHRPGVATAFNSLFVDKDCKTVETSYPGRALIR